MISYRGLEKAMERIYISPKNLIALLNNRTCGRLRNQKAF